MSVSCTLHYQTLWQLDDQVHYLRRLPHLWCLTINVSGFSLNDARIFSRDQSGSIDHFLLQSEKLDPAKKTLILSHNKEARCLALRLHSNLSSVLQSKIIGHLFVFKTFYLFHILFTCTCNLYRKTLSWPLGKDSMFTDLPSVYCFPLTSMINAVQESSACIRVLCRKLDLI